MYLFKQKHFYLAFLLILLFQATSAQVGKIETGVASFYHDKFIGRRTANGEIFTQEKFTAAHKTLPLGTWVRVTNLSNDSVVIVRINDRMPQWNKRSIDLTEAAAGKLNYLNSGVTKVKIEVIPDPKYKNTRPADLATEPIQPIKPTLLPFTGRASISPIYDLIDYEVYTQNLTSRKKRKGS